ncbi:hypothetical protein F5Y18DRAFT_251045 [Xylariaceae sp. FL1019]|nr:hypothetical protein F5Y18DRAFT_251045 [Xylariaceae sp. FL1019]
MSVTKGFSALPSELLSEIIELLPRKDHIVLSGVNTRLRGILAQHLFRTVKISNNPDSDFEALHRVAQQYATHVRKVSFIGSVWPIKQQQSDRSQSLPPSHDGSSNNATLPPVHPFLPDVVRRALSGQLFPRASAADVAFEFDFNDLPPEGGYWEHESSIGLGPDEILCIYPFDVPELEERVVREKEARYHWRKLMAETWEVMAGNKNITTLIARDTLAKPTSTFFTRKWADFLRRLGRIEIYMFATDNGAGWCSNTLEGYTQFEEHLRDYFLKDATSLESLVLAGTAETPFGSGNVRFANCALPLTPQDLPDLRYLELRDMFVSPKLSEFLSRPDSHLRTLILYNCRAEVYSQYAETWARFLRDLDTEEQGLTELRVEFDPPIPTSRGGTLYRADQETYIAIGQKLEELLQEPGAVVFSYGSCSDKYGDYMEAEDDIFTHFVRGDDLAAYYSLMAKVRRNAGRPNQSDDYIRTRPHFLEIIETLSV